MRPCADPVSGLRRAHWLQWSQGCGRQPTDRPVLFSRMQGLIRGTGEGALRPARQNYVPGNEVRFFAARIFVRGTGGVIIRTLHEIDMRTHRYSRGDEGSFHVEVDAPARVRIGFRKRRQSKTGYAPKYQDLVVSQNPPDAPNAFHGRTFPPIPTRI